MNAVIAQLESAISQSDRPPDDQLNLLAQRLWQTPAAGFEPGDIESLVQVYRQLDENSSLRHHLLRALAADGSPRSLSAFAELLVTAPPQNASEAALSCVPLLQQPSQHAAALFPRLLDALANPSTAALVLDVANHLTNQQVLAAHPAQSRTSDLIALLGGLTEGLRRLEENPRQVAADAAQLQRQIADSVALIAPLCEALALIGDSAAVGKLHQVLSLGHRRLRVLAAYALARLGEKAGTQALVELAAEPVVRPLALDSLAALGEAERVEPRYRTSVARAEGELAAWLAHPSRFGLPPTEMELIEASELPWPGYNHALECFLFSFTYQLPQVEFSGVGIVGPVTHALYADLEDLSPDDIFALYAGWSVEHEEISETPEDLIDEAQRAHWETLRSEAAAQGYGQLELVKVGHFFGDELFVAAGRKDGSAGVLVCDDQAIHWFPIVPSQRPLGPQEIYWLFLGRRILQTFSR